MIDAETWNASMLAILVMNLPLKALLDKHSMVRSFVVGPTAVADASGVESKSSEVLFSS